MIHRWKDVNLSRVTGNCIVCDIIWIEMGEELSCWPIATKSSSKTPLTTELSFDDNDHEKEKERETCREAGKKVVSPEMEELEGKMPARREARSREARSPTLWGLKRKRFERLTPFFIHPAEAAGDFPVDAEIFGERFISKTRAGGEMEIEGNSKLANSTEEILFIPRSWWLCLLRVEKTTEFFFSNDRKLKR